MCFDQPCKWALGAHMRIDCPAGTLKCLHCKRTMPGRGDATHGPPLCADCAAEEGAAARVWLVGAPPLLAFTAPHPRILLYRG